MSSRIPVAIVIGLLFVPATAAAQFEKTWKDWFGHVQGGYAVVQGELGNLLEDGWSLAGGVTYKPSEWPLGVIAELGYNDFDMTRKALDFFASSGGDSSVTSLTVGVIWAANTSGKIGFNLQAGIGGYHVKGKLTEPAYVCGQICDPLYWYWCWWGCSPGSVITDSVSSTELGYNVGAAITFDLASDSVVYLEARYHWVDTQQTAKFMPIAIGFRW